MILPVSPYDFKRESPAEYVTKLQKILYRAHELAREQLQSSQIRQKRDYDVKLQVNTYNVGDLVYVLNSAKRIGVSPKLQFIWKGPYVVSKVISPILYEITDRKRISVLHHDRLKICNDRNIPLWVRRKRSSILLGTEDLNAEEDIVNDLSLDVLFRDQENNDLESMPAESTPAESTRPQDDDSDGENSREPPAVGSEEVYLEPSRFGRKRVRPKHLSDYSSS